MMSRMNKFILFMFFLCGLINFCPVVLAQGNKVEPAAKRPLLEYTSGGLRDPFQTYITQEKKVDTQAQVITDLPKPETNFSGLKVQGIIWGTKMPQAIINDRVYIVGDKIEESEILSIDKKGVNLSSAKEGVVSLAAPGQDNISIKDNNTPR